MSRYIREFSNDDPDLFTTVASLGAHPVLKGVLDTPTRWFCKITDTENGQVAKGTGFSKTEAEDDAWRTLQDEKDDFNCALKEKSQREQKERKSSEDERGSSGDSRDNSSSDSQMAIAKLIGVAIVVIAVIWFIFAVAIPLLVINIAVIALIIAVLRTQVSKFLLPLSVAGAALVIADYNQGWFTKALAGNVPFLVKVIPILLYLNIFAGLIAAYFMIRNFMNKRSPQDASAGEFTRRNVITMGSLLLGAALVCGGIALYESIVAKASLAFGFSLDGKGLSNSQTPEVKVDGQSFGSGNKIKPGRHQISVQLANAEPLEQRFWFYFGEKNLGTLPLESSKGSLAVTVAPAPATVTLKRLDEIIRQGDAPLKIDKLPVGDYSIVVHRGEYEEIHSVKIQRQQLTESKIELELGSVSLSSDPADAEFDLSGHRRHWQGKLPMRIDDVPVGNYSLLTRRKGWELSTNILVGRGGVTTNTTEFQYGSISVTSDPTGLVISTNGVEIGKTPLTLQELKPGQYAFTATDNADNDLTWGVGLGPKEAAKHNFVFRYGTVELSSAPPGATVIRKGKEFGKTPLTLSHIPAGEATVGLKLTGYLMTNLTIQVMEGPSKLVAKLMSEKYADSLQRAERYLAAGNYSAALTDVDVALSEDPAGESALVLQNKIKNQVHLVEAEKSLSRDDYARTEENLLAAEKSLGETRETSALRNRLGKRKEEVLQRLLDDAEVAIKSQREDEASSILENAEKLFPKDPRTSAVQKKLVTLVDERKEQQFHEIIAAANQNLERDRFGEMSRLLAKAKQLHPIHDDIKSVETKFANRFDLTKAAGVLARGMAAEDPDKNWLRIRTLRRTYQVSMYRKSIMVLLGTQKIQFSSPDNHYSQETFMKQMQKDVAGDFFGDIAGGLLGQQISGDREYRIEIRGNSGERIDPKGRMQMTQPQVEGYLSECRAQGFDWMSASPSFSIDSTEQSKGEIVLRRRISGGWQKFTFEQDTGSLKETEILKDTKGALESLRKTVYGEHKFFDGIAVPTKITFYENGQKTSEKILQECSFSFN